MVWLQLGIAGAAFLLLWMFSPRPQVENSRARSLDSMTFPRADEGEPIPVIFGTRRINGPNTMWLDGFRSSPNTDTVRTGLFSEEKQIYSYSYYVSFALALCAGPGVRLQRIWMEKDEIWSGDQAGSTSGRIEKGSAFGGKRKGGGFISQFTFYSGQDSQDPNAHIMKNFPGTPGYPGVSYIVFEDAYIGTHPGLRAVSFEVNRFTNGLGLPGQVSRIGKDSNPAEILYQVLTLSWGGLGMDSRNIDIEAFRNAARTLSNENLGMSLLLSVTNGARSVIEEILRHIDGLLYQSPETGLLILRLVREDYNTEDLKVLNEDNVLRVRKYSQALWQETFNQLRVSFPNRANGYKNSMSIVQALANISSMGRIRTTNINFPYCMNGNVASRLASRELSQLSVPLFRVVLEVNRSAGYSILPGDVVRFSWKEYGLDQMLLRVRKCHTGDLLNGVIVLECLQDMFGVSQSVYAPPALSNHKTIVRRAYTPSDLNIRETPFWLARQKGLVPAGENITYVNNLVRRASRPYQLGYNSLTSGLAPFGNRPYQKSAVIVSFDPEGGTMTLSNADFDIAELKDADDLDLRRGANLLAIGDEILAFRKHSVSAPDIGLEDLERGFIDTSPKDHSPGDIVYFMDSGGINPSPAIGDALLSTSVTGYTDMDESPAADSRVTGRRRYEAPISPFGVTLSGLAVVDDEPEYVLAGGRPLTVIWKERNRVPPLLVLRSDPSQQQEPGVVYTVEVRDSSGNVMANTGATETRGDRVSFVLPVSIPGNAGNIVIYSIRTSIRSYASEFIPFRVQ